MKILKIVITVFTLTLTSNAKAESLQLYLENFPPYNYAEGKQLKGINTEIIQKLCEHTAIECDMTLYPWTRAYNLALNNNNAGVFSTGFSPERQNLFKWVGPLEASGTLIYRLKTRTDIELSDISQLRSYSIAIVRDTVTKQFMLNLDLVDEENFIEFSYLEEYLPLFFSGKVDLITGSKYTLPYILRELHYTSTLMEPIYSLGDSVYGNYLALNKNIDDAIVSKLNAALAKLKQEPEYQEIINKYTNP